MAEENENGLFCCNGEWGVIREKKVIYLGKKYQLCGNFMIGTKADGTKLPVYLKTFHKYPEVRNCFLIKDDRLVLEGFDSVWKILNPRTGVLVQLGSQLNEGGYSFIYNGEQGIKISYIVDDELYCRWCTGFTRGEKDNAITLHFAQAESELMAV